MNSSSAEVDW